MAIAFSSTLHSAFLIFAFNVITSVYSAKFCLFQSYPHSSRGVQNQSCSTGRLELDKSLMATDYLSRISSVDFNITGDLPSLSSIHCLLFRYIQTDTLPTGIVHESVSLQAHCDFDQICEGKEMNKILDKVAYTGKQGDLYCCAQDTCNSLDNMPHLLPFENRECFQGSNNKSQTPALELHSCSKPDVFCARAITYSADSRVESYFCDNQRLCANNRAYGAYKYCFNTTTPANATHELCCCNRSKCYRPPWVLLEDGRRKNGSEHDHVGVFPYGPIHNPQTRRPSNTVVTALVATVMVIAGAGVILIVVTAYRKRKRRRPPHDPDVIMQYERLSASEPEIDEAVAV